MNKIIKFLSLFAITVALAGCETTNDSNSTSQSEIVDSSSFESVDSSNSIESSSSSVSSIDDTEYTTFIDLEDVYIEIGETYSLKNALYNYSSTFVASKNINIAGYNTKTQQIFGLSVGSTYFVLTYKDQKQKLNVTVSEPGTYSATFKFDRPRLEDKNLVAFGDSVTADATLQGQGKTYVTLFAEKYGMNLLKNYAIGGTTATYMYLGSNIAKEYGNNKTALDGCRVVKNAVDNGEIDEVDYAFIAYGHNDQYFQPPITDIGDDTNNINSFASCISYKGSYRYMINKLRSANPNIRIILLNCTYSEYDKTNPSPYGNKYNYTDYRNATKDIAEEKSCKYVDPWDYMKDYFDYQDSKTYYKDSVHLSGTGHKKLSDYLFTC